MIVFLFLLSLTEEVLYRGILYRVVEDFFGIIPALLVSSGLFSILHLTNDYYNLASFFAILFGGAIMGLLFSLTKSIWCVSAAHFGWNFTQVLFGLSLSGTD